MDQIDAGSDEGSLDPDGRKTSVLGELLTLPNLISLSRVLALPLLVSLMSKPDSRFWAAALAGVMGFTDFLDGYLARGTGHVSTVGKVLDPTCDRIVLIVSAIALWYYNLVPHWLLGIMLLREALVSIAVLSFAVLLKQRFDVVWIGKLGTFILLAGVPFAVLSQSSAMDSPLLLHVSEVAILIGTLILYGAAYEYVAKFIELFKVKKLQ